MRPRRQAWIVRVDVGDIPLAGIEERERDLEFPRAVRIHAADEPLGPAPPRNDAVLANGSPQDLRVIPDGRAVVEELQFRLVAQDVVTARGHPADVAGAIVPVKELPRAIEANGLGELVGMRGLLVDPLVIIADGDVGGAGQHAAKQRHELQLVGLPLLVAADALLGDQVRIGPRIACWPVLVVDVNHQAAGRRLADRPVQPGGPLLRADVDETELDPRHAPLLIKWKDFIGVAFQGLLIDVQDDADADVPWHSEGPPADRGRLAGDPP